MIIGFAGLKGHGKTTIAKIMAQSLEGAALMSFADPIRAFAEACGFDLSRKEDPDPRLVWSPRKFMQAAGTEFGRDMVGSDFWLRSMGTRIERAAAEHVVIHDVRFLNERDWVRERGGVVLWIHRPMPIAGVFDPHPSENSILSIDCDADLINDRDPETVAITALGIAMAAKERAR